MVQRSSFSEHVEFPFHDGNPETVLVFGVEMMPEYYPYAVLACAVSPMDGTHGSPLGPSTSLRILGSSYLSATLGRHTSLSDITSRTIALAYVKRETA